MNSKQFREARIKVGLTQKELALKMGMQQQNISRIERGKRQPTRQQAKHIECLVDYYFAVQDRQ